MRRETTVSVIIPTHNRSASVRRELDALSIQTYPPSKVEVVVVADGCTDDTAQVVSGYDAPFHLRILEQSSQGAAAARNHGAASAGGRLLIFLDDDIEPAPSLAEAHVRAHEWPQCQVGIGYLPPLLPDGVGYFPTALRNWWEDKFHAMRQPGHRYSYRDLLSGNLSIQADAFAKSGGFDTAFVNCAGEDYEYGARLIQAGMRFAFLEKAWGYHHERAELDRSFRRAYQQGIGDVLIGARHPGLRPTLPLAHFGSPGRRLRRLLRALAFRRPWLGDALAAYLRRRLAFLEQIRLYRRWRRLYNQLHDYWYWRGVATQIGTPRALVRFLHNAPAYPAGDDSAEIEIDLRQGIGMAERRLDAERPASVRLSYGSQPVGRIPAEPGAERLRGPHLRPALATELAWPLAIALALEETQGTPAGADAQLPLSRTQVVEGTYANQGI